jgi:hypothetical protein
MSNSEINTNVDDDRLKDIFNKALILVDLSKKMGQKDINIITETLFSSEPFCNFPEMKMKIKEECKNGY